MFSPIKPEIPSFRYGVVRVFLNFFHAFEITLFSCLILIENIKNLKYYLIVNLKTKMDLNCIKRFERYCNAPLKMFCDLKSCDTKKIIAHHRFFVPIKNLIILQVKMLKI